MEEKTAKLRSALIASMGDPLPMLVSRSQQVMECFYNTSDLKAIERFREFLEKNYDQGIDISSVRLKLDQSTSRQKRKIMVIMEEKNDDIIMVFQPFSEAAFRYQNGNVVSVACFDELPLLTLVFPYERDIIYVRNKENTKEQPFVFDKCINLLLMNNESFRNVLCSILSCFGCQILDDLVQAIRRDHCLLLPFSIEDFLSFSDKEELLFEYNWSGISLPPLDLSLNQWFYLLRMSLPLQDEDWNLLIEYCQETADYLSVEDTGDDGPDTVRFFTNYLMSKNPDRVYQETWNLVENYVKECLVEQERLLSIKTLENL